MSAAPNLDISIVVACRNEATHIRAFLDSLLNQDLAGYSWEVIIADGMSNDGTGEILREASQTNSRIRVIPNEGRIVSTGLNAAIRAAHGQVILRMDAHTLYAADYCRQCVETLKRTGAANVGGPPRTTGRGLVARAIAAAFHSPLSTGGGKFHDERYEGWVDTVPFGCWRKETLLGLGLFDESLVRNQDDELNLRTVLAGGKIWQTPQIRSWYSPRSTLLGLWRQYFQYGFWKVTVIRKHRLPGSWRHLVPCAFVLGNVTLALSIGLAVAAENTDWARSLAVLWLLAGLIYFGALALGSAVAARRHGMALLPVLPLVFAVYHLSYGIGFCIAVTRLFFRPSRDIAADSVFARLSR